MPDYVTIEISCPECGEPVKRKVPLTEDGFVVPRAATGVCEHCWPWDGNSLVLVEDRTVRATMRRAAA